MDAAAALHNAARAYCLDRIDHWYDAYAALESAGRSEVRQPDGSRSDTVEAHGIYPRYLVLQAILSAVERATATDFASVEAARTWLTNAGRTAEDLFTKDPADPAAAHAMAEERAAFIAFVEQSDQDDWRRCLPLPYRRVLRAEEADALTATLRQRWGHWYGGVPSDPRHAEQCLTLHTDWTDHLPGFPEALQSILSARRIGRLFELREYGDCFELDVAAASFCYDGAEGSWCDRDLDWMINASHEATITFGGGWLIQAVRDATPGIDQYVLPG